MAKPRPTRSQEADRPAGVTPPGRTASDARGWEERLKKVQETISPPRASDLLLPVPDLPALPDPLGSDSPHRRLAAFRFGHRCHHISECLLRLKSEDPMIFVGEVRAGWIETAFAALAEYDALRTILADFLGPRALEGIPDAVAPVETLVRGLHAELTGRPPRPSRLAIDPLPRLIGVTEDQPIDPRFPVAPWYRLGQAFGRWEWLSTNLWLSRPLWFTSSSHFLGPPFSPVVEAASQLSSAEAADHPVVRLLHEVGRTAGTAAEASTRDAIVDELIRQPLVRERVAPRPFARTSDREDHRNEFHHVVRAIREQVEAHLHHVPAPRTPVRPSYPIWAASSGKLWWGDRVVLSVRARDAGNCRTLLDAFEARIWREGAIPNPLTTKDYASVGNAIRDLNRKVRPDTIRFSVDRGSLRWAPCPDA
jgi:hypothetical protein